MRSFRFHNISSGEKDNTPFLLNGQVLYTPVMGKINLLHFESSKVGFSAPEGFFLINLQPWSIDVVVEIFYW
jgi:hypothetical protein